MPRDRHRGDARAAGEVENPLRPSRDQADEAPLPQAIDAEGRDIDYRVVRAPRAAKKPFDERYPGVVFRR
jgi:hypothetical protein